MSAHPTQQGRQMSPRRAAKTARRRQELVDSALTTMTELGYARTSLREIAQNSEFTHGVVHYYFADKSELMGQCVRDVKASCITRYDDVIATATTREDFHERFLDRLVESLLVDATQHRLWYDIRVQSMYEEALRDDVMFIDRALEDMIGRILTRYAELAGSALTMPTATAYAMFDGVFERALLHHLAGDPEAVPQMRETVDGLLTAALEPVPAGR